MTSEPDDQPAGVAVADALSATEKAVSPLPAPPRRRVLFTPGPVMMHDYTLREGGQPIDYHRTAEFSRQMLHCEQMLKRLCDARPSDRVVLLTASGTAAMEAVVLNLFRPREQMAAVNSGEFGGRFVEIARLHGHELAEIALEPGRQIRGEDLARCRTEACTGFLLNHHETSTGSLLDLDLVSRFCRERGLLLVVDAIGSFLADPLSMTRHGIDALIFSTQKGLALPPGLSFVVLSERAVQRISAAAPRAYYLDLRRHLTDMQRGQTPFTPAIGLVRQLELRLERILEHEPSAIIDATRRLAEDFRAQLAGLPLRIFPECPSNAVTALAPTDDRPPDCYVRRLADDYGLCVCPNGGKLKDRIFRVGHLGDLTWADNARLVRALRDVATRRP
jgi:aspartate aminotransferase-like enzyme